ncbi:MAG: hypothetical protein AAGF10_07745, partial [Verrucomicrobiota bacterium]
KRTDAMLQAEIRRGYALLYNLIDTGLAKEDADWTLPLLKAQAQFDEAEYLYGINEDLADYTAARERAFATFAEAEKQYAQDIKDGKIPHAGHASLYIAWFNAAMGASDIGGLARQQDPDLKVIEQIGAAMRALPEKMAEKHLDSFATLAFTTHGISPELKPRYVRHALQIVGDRGKAEKGQELLAYYDALLKEVKLHAALDGNGIVGHQQPFGILLSLHHTETLDREAGGFSRYLKNQKQSSGYNYSPGGPRGRQDYRDALDQKIREALVEGYDIQSITYFDPDAEPRALPEAGWREKPLAYILAQAKDAARDQIDGIQMDLDFMDKTRMPVVLPVESAPLLVDSRPETVPARPVDNAKVELILDDRKIDEGYVALEVTAKGEGLLPPLDSLLDLDQLDLQVAENDDQGLSVASLQTEGERFAALTERNWFLKLIPKEGAGKISSFTFPEVKLENAEVDYLRYNDADVEEVDPKVALAGFPLHRGNALYLWLILLLALAAGALAWWFRQQQQGELADVDGGLRVPENPSVFGALTFLRSIQKERQSQLSAEQRDQLQEDINRVESRYFSADSVDAKSANPSKDLHPLLRKWEQAVRGER